MSDQVAIESVTPDAFVVRVSGGDAIAGQLSVDQNNINFAPDDPLADLTTYEVKVCGIRDLVGNAGGCHTSTFTTAYIDRTPPTCRLDAWAPVLTGRERSYAPAATEHEPTAYTWDFGNGETVGPQEEEAAAVTYTAPGRYPVTLRVSNANGRGACSSVQVVHAPPTATPPVSSSSIITVSTAGTWDAYVANPDNDTVTRISGDLKRWEKAVGDHPRTLAAAPNGNVWVANQGSDDITILNRRGLVFKTIDLGYGAAPYGLVFAPDGAAAYVTLTGKGRLLKLSPDGAVTAELALPARPRGIAVSGDSSRILVTRFVSAFAETGAVGQVYDIDAATFTLTRTVDLAFDPGPDSESGGRGVPNYLSQIRIAPDGETAWIPSKKDNMARGLFRDGKMLTFESQTRAIVSQIDLTANAEALDRRIDFNDRDLAQSLVFTPGGDAFIVAFQGSNALEVWNANGRNRMSDLDIGQAPQGLALTPDGRRLYVHNFLDRSVSVYDSSGLLDGSADELTLVTTVPTVGTESLAANVLAGKRIFYNAADPRMSLDGYLSCASCHLDGGADGMVWDRTQFGEGLRNTIDLRGRRGANGGLVHWTANFDEIQDFEHDIRDSFGGSGFMADADFRTGTRDEPLGDPKAGVSAELDALAAYITSLSEVPDSPYRASDGSLTAAGLTGRTVVRDKGCARCHAGADFTDDLIHDVDTVASSSGQASGAPLAGINTPTLRGLWLSAPYLHNGSLATLAAVLDGATHMGGALTGEEKSALEAYLLQIDGKESGVTGPSDVTLRLMPASIGENGGRTTVTARLSAASTEATTVTVSAAAVSPAVAGDFTLSANKTLTITAGRTGSTGTVTIAANNNAVDAPDKTVTVRGTATNGAGVTGPSAMTLTIVDDDAAPSLALSVSASTIDEDGGTATVTVSTGSGSTFATAQTVRLSLAGTATETADYTISGKTLTLPAGIGHERRRR